MVILGLRTFPDSASASLLKYNKLYFLATHERCSMFSYLLFFLQSTHSILIRGINTALMMSVLKDVAEIFHGNSTLWWLGAPFSNILVTHFGDID